MSIIDPALLEGVDKPELIIGLVAPVGTPLTHLCSTLTDELNVLGYQCEEIHLSKFLSDFDLPTGEPSAGASDFTRIDTLMTRGNELREALGGGEALALLAAADIQSRRPDAGLRAVSGRALILNQLKHPDEVIWLRTIYGSAFHLVGVFCPEESRLQHLHVGRGMSQEEAKLLIKRDKGEQTNLGQQVTEAFQHSDIFVELKGYQPAETQDAQSQLRRYLRLLFGYKDITPTYEEYGMFLAQSAAYRSADLSRQVGAAVLTQMGEVVSLGANEVPSSGGGQYWTSPTSRRDFEMGRDENAKIKFENLEEMLAIVLPDWEDKMSEEKEEILAEMSRKLKNTRIMNLTEFGRSVHAEMDALLSAGRIGTSVKECNLYCTTFPCHNCAKHIVTAGIRKVIYIEPYPKSLAARLHSNALTINNEDSNKDKVAFEPFRGVAPRMYSTLFSSMNSVGKRVKRKNDAGDFDTSPAGLRAKAFPLSYIDREAAVALYLDNLFASDGLS